MSRIMAKGLATAALVGAVALVALVLIVPRAVGGTSLTVLSGSMSPTIPKGSMVLVKPVDPDTLEVGDVITWQVRPNEATYITHRIVEIDRGEDGTSRAFVTKGDANDHVDSDPVVAGSVRGKVVFDIPFLGGGLDFVRSPVGLGILAAAAGTVLTAGQLRRLVGRFRSDHRGSEQGAAPVDAVSDQSASPRLRGELVVVRLESLTNRRQFADVVDILGGRVIGEDDEGLTGVLVGAPHEFHQIEELVEPFGAATIRRVSVDAAVASAPADRTRGTASTGQDDGLWSLLVMNVRADTATRREIAEVVRACRGTVTAVHPSSVTVRVGDTAAQCDRVEMMMAAYGVVSKARSEDIVVPNTWSGSTSDPPRPDPTLTDSDRSGLRWVPLYDGRGRETRSIALHSTPWPRTTAPARSNGSSRHAG